MTNLRAVVYPPPSNEFPALAVVLDANSEVIAARASPTAEEAEKFLEWMVDEIEERFRKASRDSEDRED